MQSPNTGATVYYHQDGLGSTTALTDPSGTVVESYTYYVFGDVTVYDSNNSQLATSNYANRFAFTGREYLAELTLYDTTGGWGASGEIPQKRNPEGDMCGSEGVNCYRNRVYSADLGRFLQTDPIRFDAGDVNLYRYVANNPVEWIDPLGEKVTCSGWTTAGELERKSFYRDVNSVVIRTVLKRLPLSLIRKIRVHWASGLVPDLVQVRYETTWTRETVTHYKLRQQRVCWDPCDPTYIPQVQTRTKKWHEVTDSKEMQDIAYLIEPEFI